MNITSRSKPRSWRQTVSDHKRREAQTVVGLALDGMKPFYATEPTKYLREDQRSSFPMMNAAFNENDAVEVRTAISWQRRLMHGGEAKFANNSEVYEVVLQGDFLPRQGLIQLKDTEKWQNLTIKDPNGPSMRMCFIGAEALPDGPAVIGVDARSFERLFEQEVPTYLLNFFTHVGQPFRSSVRDKDGYPEYFFTSLQLMLNHSGLARAETVHVTHNLRSRNSFLLCGRPSRSDRDSFCNLYPLLSRVSSPCSRCGSFFPSLLAFLTESSEHLNSHHLTHSLKSTSQNYRDMYDYSLDDVSLTGLLGRKHHDIVKGFVDNLDLTSRTEFNWSLFCHTLTGLQKAHTRYKAVREEDGLCHCDETVEAGLNDLSEHANDMRSHATVIKSRKNDLLNLTYPLVSLFDSHLNFQVASASRHIAHETKRDSTAMKVISAVTVVFLPPTFACSIFGMQFFSYENNPDGQSFTVSRMWWLYLAIALPLTVLTTGIWLFWVWWKDQIDPENEKD